MSFYRAPNGVGLLPCGYHDLPGPFISTFGILSKHRVNNEETCHFCLDTLNNSSEDPLLELPCCGHSVHCKCFHEWALQPRHFHGVHCAYCRTPYDFPIRCFLCLEYRIEGQPVKLTSCCTSKVHFVCFDALVAHCRSHFAAEYTLECGQLNYCCCLWKTP